MKPSAKAIQIPYSVIIDYGGSDWNTTAFPTLEDAEDYIFEVAEDYLDDMEEDECEQFARLIQNIVIQKLANLQQKNMPKHRSEITNILMFEKWYSIG